MAKETVATQNKNADTVLNHYIELYVDKYGTAPVVNRYKSRWAFKDMVADLGGVAHSKKVVEYYFRTSKLGHPLDGLFYNYTELNANMLEDEEDERRRAEWRRETEQRVKEWEARGNK